MNANVARRLVVECTNLYALKNWTPDSVARLHFLPRTCELRNVESVPDWLQGKFAVYQAAASSNTSGRTTRRSGGAIKAVSNDAEPSSESEEESDSTPQVPDDLPSTSYASTSKSGSRATRRRGGKASPDKAWHPQTTIPKSPNVLKRAQERLASKKRPLVYEEEDDEEEEQDAATDSFVATTTSSTSNNIAMQVMLDQTRQLRTEMQEMKREQRNTTKRLHQLELTIGRLVAEDRQPQRSSTDSANASFQESVSGRVDGRVGSFTWIRQVYGSQAKRIIDMLNLLNVSEEKWALIFDARFHADKLMAQRLLDARFSEDELANFCMSRPNQTRPKDKFRQPLRAADGSLLAPTKAVLPNQREMLGK